MYVSYAEMVSELLTRKDVSSGRKELGNATLDTCVGRYMNQINSEYDGVLTTQL
jgi:hypothetical protein